MKSPDKDTPLYPEDQPDPVLFDFWPPATATKSMGSIHVSWFLQSQTVFQKLYVWSLSR